MIKSAIINNFMGYGAFNSGEFAPINVIIGKNDTGKTGLLKMLYSTVKTIDIYSRKKAHQDISFKKLLAEKLYDTFQPGKKGLGELVAKGAKEKLSVNLEFNHPKLTYQDRLQFTFGESTTNTIVDCQEQINTISENFRCLFIPSKEVLTTLKAIRATRDNLQIPGFDDTYLDLIRAVVVPTQKGNITEGLKDVNKRMEELFEGRIEQGTDDDFVFKKGNTEFQMQLTSEGVKKIGILTTLIRNRQLNSNTVLFLDEPETALHPEATRVLVEMLMTMAKAGIQIFIATHNYFVLKQIYLCAKKGDTKTNCYSLSKDHNNTLQYNIYNLQDGLPENEISNEAITMADEEIRLDLGL